jgi:hypothetical protein
VHSALCAHGILRIPALLLILEGGEGQAGRKLGLQSPGRGEEGTGPGERDQYNFAEKRLLRGVSINYGGWP